MPIPKIPKNYQIYEMSRDWRLGYFQSGFVKFYFVIDRNTAIEVFICQNSMEYVDSFFEQD